MTRQDISQTARLKLEHHPYGQRLLLLISPFYARPSHFWNSQNSIIGRLGFIVPILPAMLFYQLANSSMETAMRYYAAKQAITLPVLEAFNTAGNITAWLMLLCVSVVIYIGALVRFGYNKMLCGFWRNGLWQKYGLRIRPATYAYYLVNIASSALWFCFFVYATLKMFHFGIDTTTALVTQFIDNYPKIVLFLLAGWVVLREIKSRNELSSSMEIYGSQIVVFVNTGITLVLLVGMLYLLRFLVGA